MHFCSFVFHCSTSSRMLIKLSSNCNDLFMCHCYASRSFIFLILLHRQERLQRERIRVLENFQQAKTYNWFKRKVRFFECALESLNFDNALGCNCKVVQCRSFTLIFIINLKCSTQVEYNGFVSKCNISMNCSTSYNCAS